MNKTRLKQLNKIREQIDTLKDDLQNLLEAENECFDNLPESLQNTEQGEDMQNWIDKLQNAIDYLGDAVSELEKD